MRFLLTPLFFCIFYGAEAQINKSIEVIREETLQPLRSVRGELSRTRKTSVVDSLQTSVNEVIIITQKMRNREQLEGVEEYFKKVETLLKNEPDTKRGEEVIRMVNQDLALKLSKVPATGEFRWEPSMSFAATHTFTITALINGNPTTGKFRLYWSHFLGEDLEALIRKEAAEGSSNELLSPYQLQLKLPGYITFWLKDVTNNQLYRPDILFKSLTPQDRQMQVSFQLLQ